MFEAASWPVCVSNGGAQVTLVPGGTRQMLGLFWAPGLSQRRSWVCRPFLLGEGELVEVARQE